MVKLLEILLEHKYDVELPKSLPLKRVIKDKSNKNINFIV